MNDNIMTPQMFPSQQAAPNLVLQAIADLVRSKIGDDFELKPDRNNNITLIVRDGLLSFQLTKISDNTIAPQDESKLYMIWNGTVTRNQSDQNNGRDLDSKVVHASVAYLLNWIEQHLNQINTPNYTQHAYAKAAEPYTRVAADEGEKQVSDTEIDKAIEELKHEFMSSEIWEDGDQTWNADEMYRKNVVKTFPKDEPKVEGEKRPAKSYLKDQGALPANPPKDSVVNWNKGEKLNEGVRLVLNENGEVMAVPSSKTNQSVQRNHPRNVIKAKYDPLKDGSMKDIFKRRAGIAE